MTEAPGDGNGSGYPIRGSCWIIYPVTPCRQRNRKSSSAATFGPIYKTGRCFRNRDVARHGYEHIHLGIDVADMCWSCRSAFLSFGVTHTHETLHIIII